MVRDQSDGNIIHGIRLIGLAGNSANLIADGLHGIDIKNGIHILHHHGQTLQTHARIDVFIFKLRITALAVAVKLGKHVIPYFHEAIAVAAHLAIRLTASVLLSAIVIDLGTGTAGTCAMLPKVIALSGLRIAIKPRDLLRGNTDLLGPDLKRLIILSVNGWIQTLRSKAKHFR